MVKVHKLQAACLGMVTVLVAAAACQMIEGIEDKQLIPAGSSSGSGGAAGMEAGVTDTKPDAARDVGDTAVKDTAAESTLSACGVEAGVSLELADRQVIRDDPTEAAIEVPIGHVITGVGLRINKDQVRTLHLQARALNADGSLGPEKPFSAGDEPGSFDEAEVMLPPCYVAVGVGARCDKSNAKTLIVWASPLSPDGSLGPTETFRGGGQPDEPVESEYQAPAGRVLTGVGFGLDNDNVVGMRVVTHGWVVH